jgi:hypothetical protein
MIDLSSWPEGSRLILRKERPHPGAQLTFTDIDGHRVTAFLTDTGRGVIPGQVAGLELRHRQHARWRTASAKARQPACAISPVTAGRRIMPGWRPCWPPPTGVPACPSTARGRLSGERSARIAPARSACGCHVRSAGRLERADRSLAARIRLSETAANTRLCRIERVVGTHIRAPGRHAES